MDAAAEKIPEMTGVRSQFLADVVAHDTHDAFWKAMSIRDKYAEMDVPAFHVTGWYDDLSARRDELCGNEHAIEK
jgi:predicted acyl esterase